MICYREAKREDIEFMASAIQLGFLDGWSKEKLVGSFNGGRFYGFIAEDNGKSVGFVTLTCGLDDADIEDVFVVPSYRRQGIADGLIERALTLAKNSGAKKVLLEVRASNLSAINLYRKHGFTNLSVRKKYYADGEDALVLILTV